MTPAPAHPSHYGPRHFHARPQIDAHGDGSSTKAGGYNLTLADDSRLTIAFAPRHSTVPFSRSYVPQRDDACEWVFQEHVEATKVLKGTREEIRNRCRPHLIQTQKTSHLVSARFEELWACRVEDKRRGETGYTTPSPVPSLRFVSAPSLSLHAHPEPIEHAQSCLRSTATWGHEWMR
ncbi:hypothetical protein Hypma_014635 [Hypsizygus marmoreus]|uniref:Uncharacterized protein n=1 Tax=Hypsizygus marmoreus TaxID=39966 RepID=A0A369J933_HYPMA|nr:hypothetical protein Hypma_014635 [Hypsizygus marmoreus]